MFAQPGTHASGMRGTPRPRWSALELPATGPSPRHAQDPPFADNIPALAVISEKGTTVTSTVGVVVTTYNHAHFLDDALISIFSQGRSPDAVIVVDDGSSDDPAAVVRRFPGAQLIRQENRGLAAARNAGLRALDADFILFLDADDRLEPHALEMALRCFARVPECGFVYGGHRYIDGDGRSLGERFEPPGDVPYEHLLRRNFIAMHGTVMYSRARLMAAGGFDESLRRCEDYDVYLRMAKRYAIAGYAGSCGRIPAARKQHVGRRWRHVAGGPGSSCASSAGFYGRTSRAQRLA